MVNRLKIWVRQRIDDIKLRIREICRRQLRKLIELAITDMDLMSRLSDATRSAAFEEQYLRDAASFKHRAAFHRFVLQQIEYPDGLHLEFGVYKGNSINRFAGLNPNVTWYGFDSFVGLPEDWTLGAKAGAFSVGGRLPPVRGNVQLIAGFFEDTLPSFLAKRRDEKIALMHIDCDLHSATRTILTNVGDMLAPGSIIIFDELINYHGWEDGEYRAFTEFAAHRDLRYEYLAYNRTGSQVAVRILDQSASAQPPAPSSERTKHADDCDVMMGRR
jgi:hypothetical protein